MAHGTPDWGQIPDVAGYILTEDLAELAARLGSICTFDRRGSIFFMDDFESGVNKWRFHGQSALGTFDSFAGYAHSGGYCGRLITRAVTNAYAQIERWFSFPQRVKMGFEISFTLDGNVSFIEWGFYGFDANEWINPLVYYDVAANKLYYGKYGGGYQEFASNVDLLQQDYCFHTAKLVVDLTTNKYVRFILNDTEYDLSTNAYNIDPYGDTPQMYAYYEIKTSGNVGAISYIDNAIITRDES